MRTDSSPGNLPAREHLPATDAGTAVLDVVIPVYNEEKDLQPCVLRLHEHLKRTFPYAFRITIADNASTDTTPLVSRRLEAEIPEVRAFRLEQKGRGRALRTVWSASDAPVLAYMDVDLSTDLNALLPLVTLSAIQFGFIAGGLITIETIFSWPGLGELTYTAINDKDFPVLQGTFLVFSAGVIIANLLADCLYFVLDPRVKAT